MLEQERRDGMDNVRFPRAELRVLTLCALMNVGKVAAGSRDPVDCTNDFPTDEIDALVAPGHCRQEFLRQQEAILPIIID